MKKLALLVVCAVLLYACKKDRVFEEEENSENTEQLEESDDDEEEEAPKHPEDPYKQELTAIAKYLDSIGTLPVREVANNVTTELIRSSKATAPVFLSSSYVPTPDYYLKITDELHSFGSGAIEKMMSLQSADVIWPGNLIQGVSVNDHLLAAVPLNGYRKSGTIYLNVVSGQEGMKYSREVEDMSGAGVTQAMNDMLAPYTSGFPARFTYSQYIVHNKKEMAYYMDMDEEELDEQTKGAFTSVNWATRADKIRVMIKLSQVYFTIGYEFPGRDSLFNRNITLDYLKPYVYKDNPLCYISEVNYGRQFVLLYECSNTNQQGLDQLPTLLDRIYSGKPQTFTAADLAIYRNANIKMIQIGGKAEDGLNAVTTMTPEALHKFIVDGAVFSKDNVGAPISYTLRHVANNRDIETYKDLDVTYKEEKYELAPKDNDVEITINSIYSAPLVKTGGNGSLCGRSTFNAYYRVLLSDDNGAFPSDLQLIRNFVSEFVTEVKILINNVRTENNATNTTFNMTYRSGKLGVNTKKRIMLLLLVSYNNIRLMEKLLKDYHESATKSYFEKVIFEYNEYTQRWQIVNPSGYPPADTPFRTVRISDEFNYCRFNFTLGYSFKANYITY